MIDILCEIDLNRSIVNGFVVNWSRNGCVQSRAMFTIWSFLKLLKRYPGLVPDVDLMFDCMDRPVLNRTKYYGQIPPPLFRYCTTNAHFNIPFPDWSFWGWPEVNIDPWDDEFRSIKQGSQAKEWIKRWPRAYWKWNPDVLSPVCTELMRCNHSRFWGAQIMRQVEFYQHLRAFCTFICNR